MPLPFRVILALFLASRSLPAQTKPGEPVNTVSISGRIIDVLGGPIENGTVELRADGSNELVAMTRSDSSGGFAFASLLPQVYELQAFAPGFRLRTIPVRRGALGEDIDLGTLVLEVAPQEDLPSVPYHAAPLSASTNSNVDQPLDTNRSIKVTLCELMKEPEYFSGRLLQLRTRISPFGIDEPAVLFDRSCSAYVVLRAPNEPAARDDGNYRMFDRYMIQHRIVEATVSGTFEHQLVRFGKGADQFTLQSISDVVATPRISSPKKNR